MVQVSMLQWYSYIVWGMFVILGIFIVGRTTYQTVLDLRDVDDEEQRLSYRRRRNNVSICFAVIVMFMLRWICWMWLMLDGRYYDIFIAIIRFFDISTVVSLMFLVFKQENIFSQEKTIHDRKSSSGQ